ncbi:unnamed protein product [Caenorhabditis nigoni]
MATRKHDVSSVFIHLHPQVLHSEKDMTHLKLIFVLVLLSLDFSSVVQAKGEVCSYLDQGGSIDIPEQPQIPSQPIVEKKKDKRRHEKSGSRNVCDYTEGSLS